MGLAYALARIEQANRSWIAILLPGWGNPEPSWLRSHPATEQRIRRLQEYAASFQNQQWLIPSDLPLDYIGNTLKRAPRWRIGGLWH